MNGLDLSNPWRPGDTVRYFCSWSGGKDCCLALHRAIREWGLPVCLVNMLTEDGEHSRSHGLPRRVLQAQAEALGVPLVLGSATWADYEAEFVRLLQPLSAQGVEAGVFGDIDLPAHWEWEKEICARAGMTAVEPLWQATHEELVSEFLTEGFEALIVTVDTIRVPENFLGRRYSEALTALRELAVDVSGEGGEFHTVVTDGPIFNRPIETETVGIHRQQTYATLQLR